MKIKVLTLFPHFYDSFLDTSIIKRAVGKGIVDFSAVDIRSFTKDKYGRVDSAPVGGGAACAGRARCPVPGTHIRSDGW